MLPLIDRDRFDIEVAYVLPWKDDFRRPIEALGAPVTCLGRGANRTPIWVHNLRRLLRQRNFDLVHTHAPVPGVAARMVAVGPDRPVLIHTEHNVWGRYRWPTRYANAWTINRNEAVVAVSETVAESIRPPRGRSLRLETIHHGTSLAAIRTVTGEDRQQARRQLGLPAEGFVLGKVASLTAKKDHATLFRALAAEGPIAGAHLVLIGAGPLDQELRQLAAQLGLAERVTFLGSRDDVFDLLPLLDAFVLSSRHEGFPISLVEAMATGLPCVATSVGGIPEILRDGVNGLMVPPGQPEALRTALVRIITDPGSSSAWAQAGRESAAALDLSTSVQAMETVYRSALGGRRCLDMG